MLENIRNGELDLDKLISISWDLFKKNFKAILIITLIVYIPINIILYYAYNNIKVLMIILIMIGKVDLKRHFLDGEAVYGLVF